MPEDQIPNPLIAEVNDALAWFHTHSQLGVVFQRSGAPGDPPQGNKIDKCSEWLRRTNNDETVSSLAVLGGVLEEFLEKDSSSHPQGQELQQRQERVKQTLARFGLTYQQGGRILDGKVAWKPLRNCRCNRSFSYPCWFGAWQRTRGDCNDIGPRSPCNSCGAHFSHVHPGSVERTVFISHNEQSVRIWDIAPRRLCRNHLLGEHRELHPIWSVIVNGKKGYSRHPETLRWKEKLKALYGRHEALVVEMSNRGYQHRSPLAKRQATGTARQTIFVDSPRVQIGILRNKRCQCDV